MPTTVGIRSSIDVLAQTGPLADYISGFAVREEQQSMAQAVEAAITEQQTLVVEAGTGVGKTFAYLVPALLADKKIIISTGTKSLQDQLFKRDLPIILKALAIDVKVVLLKGRSNYLCLLRMHQNSQAGLFYSKNDLNHLRQILTWSARTKTGDIVELANIPEDALIWPAVTSTVDNCLGSECDYFHDCFLVRARRRAEQAKLIVINHHLFFSDIKLKDNDFAELLPTADTIILDEAHQLAEIATNFFGRSVGSRALFNLIRECQLAVDEDAKEMTEFVNLCLELQTAITAMRSSMGEERRREDWRLIQHKQQLRACIANIIATLSQLTQALALVAQRSKALENCWERSTNLLTEFKYLCDGDTNEEVHWFETFSKSFMLYKTPLAPAKYFAKYKQQQECAWIFTSATLTVNNNFDHFNQNLGLVPDVTLQLESPFDYPQQALFYVPRNLPDPRSQNFIEGIVEFAIPVIQASQGRTFFLFTSHWALRMAAKLLQERIDFPLLLQGEMSKLALLEQYRSLGNAVLLGTSSFWEGVDVRGEGLSCVIIDKLPFAAPGDPVLRGKINALKQQGKDPFTQHQLPQAVIALKQGVGRLIRDPNDRGVLMICDPRLLRRSYGHAFLKSLPAMRRTRCIDDVNEFFQ